MGKIIIFDFDGVLADSLQSVFSMNEEAAHTIGKTLTREQYISGFEGHINERLALILNLTAEEKEQFIAAKAELFPRYSNPENIQLFTSAKELVLEAQKLGELWIVSSSPSELITAILDHSGLTDCFKVIHGQNRQPKHLFLNEALADRRDETAYFITDTTGDIKAVRLADCNIHTIAVTWGFQSSALLKSENPELLADSHTQILEYIKSH